LISGQAHRQVAILSIAENELVLQDCLRHRRSVRFLPRRPARSSGQGRADRRSP
jgi:hypothetical protein